MQNHKSTIYSWKLGTIQFNDGSDGRFRIGHDKTVHNKNLNPEVEYEASSTTETEAAVENFFFFFMRQNAT